MSLHITNTLAQNLSYIFDSEIISIKLQMVLKHTWLIKKYLFKYELDQTTVTIGPLRKIPTHFKIENYCS